MSNTIDNFGLKALLELINLVILFTSAFLPVTDQQLTRNEKSTSENIFGYLIALWLYLFGYNWYSHGHAVNIVPLASFYLTLLIAITFKMARGRSNDLLSGIALMSLFLVIPFYAYAYSNVVFSMTGLYLGLAVLGSAVIAFVIWAGIYFVKGLRNGGNHA